MPIYDYTCAECGPFSDFRPLAAFDADAPCPACNKAAPRALLSVPNVSAGSSKRGSNFAANAAAPSHPSRCGCCTTPAFKTPV